MSKRLKKGLSALVVLAVLFFIGVIWASSPASTTLPPEEIEVQSSTGLEPLLAGFGKSDITPKGEVFLAGFSHNRKSTGVNDKLFARCLYIEKGDFKLALVSLDLLGVQHHRLEQIKQGLKSQIEPSNIIIASTHTHSGPDTIGFWGSWLLSSGIDDKYMKQLETGIQSAVKTALTNKHAVKLESGKANVPAKTVKNIREPGIFDPELSVLSFVPLAGNQQGPIILFNFGVHPEVLWGDNTIITADWPFYAISLIETQTRGQAIFFNGALGAMITPDVKVDKSGEEVHTFEESQRIGTIIGNTAIQALGNSTSQLQPIQLAHARRTINIPIENRFYVFAKRVGLIERPVNSKNARTSVNAIKLGDAIIVTIPGEVYPKLWASLKNKLDARVKMVFSVADDELGYILYPEDRAKELYAYERSMGPGDSAGPMIDSQLEELNKRLKLP